MTFSKHPETLALHAGYHADCCTGSVAVPIYQTTAYQFEDTEKCKKLFALSDEGDFYSRVSNPTVRVLEKRVAAIEQGKSCVCLSSGQAAACAVVQNVAQSGDNIVAADNMYGGTMTLLRFTLQRCGIEVRFVDPRKPENFADATDEKTRLWFGEAFPNPNLTPFPIAETAALGNVLGVPLVIDNTTTPIICEPFRHGAALIIHSLTKYFGGSGNSLAGAVIDGGMFDWQKHAIRFPSLCMPDASYHDIIWTEAGAQFSDFSPFIQRLRFCLLRDVGYSLSPMNAFLILQGMESMTLRLQKHSENALKVAAYLKVHPMVKEVLHPSVFQGIDGERARKYLPKTSAGLMGIYLQGNAFSGEKFINSLKLFHHVSNIGDTRSLATLPSSATHSQLNAEEQAKGGVNESFVRLSIGIEHIDDIIADLEQALIATQ